MTTYSRLTTLCAVLSLVSAGRAANTGSAFYGDPPDEHHPWAVHDQNRPQPKLVSPGTFGSPEQPGKSPSDAIVLFDGKDLSKWEADEGGGVPTKWVIVNGAMECVPHSGYIRTREKLGDCQLHVEWAAPSRVEGESQGRGNSGVFLMGLVEIQVLDNYHNPTYADGFAASVYGQTPPLANALLPPGQFQTYDIVFRRPIFKDGKELDPGYVTVFENGVLVQDHARLEGPTGHMARSKPGAFAETGPLKLQDHGNPVRFRNIWYRPLPPRVIEGGTDGYLSAEATQAKREQIAAMIRADAEKLADPANPVPQMLRLAESLVYEIDEDTGKKCSQLGKEYMANLQQLPAAQLEAKKNEIKHMRDICKWAIKFGLMPADSEAEALFEQIIKDHNWDQKKKT